MNPVGILKSLDLCFLHELYLASQELHIFGAILALVEDASVTVQQQARLFLLPEDFSIAAHRYDGAERRRFRLQTRAKERGALH